MRKLTRPFIAAAAVALGGSQLLLAGPAQAVPPSTVWIEGTTLRFYDTSNVVNRVSLAADGAGFVRVTDSLGNVAAQAPCVPVGPKAARCPSGTLRSYSFDFRGGADLFVNSTGLGGVAIGGAGSDHLVGGSGAEVLTGGDANDRLMGRGGNDRMYGGLGTDWASYADRTAGVRVRLDNAIADDGQVNIGEKDLVWPDIENVDGGLGADLLIGSNVSNWLHGYDGNDSIYGLGGNDRLMPGLGKDRVLGGTGTIDLIDYANRTGGVSVTLHDGVANEGQGGEGDFADAAVEGILGGTANDYLVGNNGNNVIAGNGGFDRVYGLAGNDSLWGGTGNDLMYGYAGHDTLRGGEGQDQMFGHDGNDAIRGEAGNPDKGDGGTGADVCSVPDTEQRISC